ncbi:hypothetical protein TNCV_2261061 [Trichonephila clavipes]|nr:hypothetical protein TNCV_2261061 [Trichonephila clavipes]
MNFEGEMFAGTSSREYKCDMRKCHDNVGLVGICPACRMIELLLLMPPDRQCQMEAHEIHRGKELDVGMSLELASRTIQVTL